MPNQKILIVDDDQNICELLRLYLAKEGYETLIAHDGEKALELFEQNKPNMVLLDVMMPKMDGWEVCRRIRAQANTPIIMLTAKGETFDKVLGLELGADDYVVKPFDSKEVVARIKAVLRRCNPEESGKDGVIQFANLSLDMSRYELKVKGKVVDTKLAFTTPERPPVIGMHDWGDANEEVIEGDGGMTGASAEVIDPTTADPNPPPVANDGLVTDPANVAPRVPLPAGGDAPRTAQELGEALRNMGRDPETGTQVQRSPMAVEPSKPATP